MADQVALAQSTTPVRAKAAMCRSRNGILWDAKRRRKKTRYKVERWIIRTARHVTVPEPDTSLGCRILPIPTAVNTSFYCCPCG
jgi:hypothetical protein